MRFRELADPFYTKQPPRDFIEDLKKPVHNEKYFSGTKKKAKKGETEIKKLFIKSTFEDKEGLLDSSFADFDRFLSMADIEKGEGDTVLEIKKGKTSVFEEYHILIEDKKITVTANDTEGIRRALIFLEDEMRRHDGAILTKGNIERRPFVKTRISRCFFSSPSHSPDGDYVNELCDDLDYYPEEYLNRLMHDGINGLWIGAHFRDILESSVIPEYAKDGKRRIAKLQQIVEKCRKYGIFIYFLVVEPASGYANEIFKSHKELHGDDNAWIPHFCPSLPACEKYLNEAIEKLFTLVPNLKGLINITTGEAESGCGSVAYFSCKRCKAKYGSLGKTLAATEKIMADAMKRVAPHAEFISWTYSQRTWKFEDIRDACRARDKNVIHMENFEDYGFPRQLSKERLAIDYWLSYVGPGKVMETAVEENKKRGITTYAKIQACSSHEISTVPYVPAPGILYDKYKYMLENGIHGALMCWYFGNYPCLMNKAACELSFLPFIDEKKDFLHHLLGIYYRNEELDRMCRAYELFERGYKNFPCSVSFEWYGPMQDAPASPLRLLPIDLPMPESWLCKSMPGGDRICDCLRDGHTVEEAEILVSRMVRDFKAGSKILANAKLSAGEDVFEKYSVANAIALLFESGYNLIHFYKLRRDLGTMNGDVKAILAEMKALVYEEIENSKKLIPLCEQDKRLGYHSEANGYKFFPEKIKWRIAQLEELLKTEFPLVEKRIEEGKAPLTFYLGEDEEQVRYTLTDAPIEECEEMYFVKGPDSNEKSELTSLRAREENGKITLAFTMKDSEGDSLIISPELPLFKFHTQFTLTDGNLYLNEKLSHSFFGDKVEKRRKSYSVKHESKDGTQYYELTFKRRDFAMKENEPFRFAVRRYGKHPDNLLPQDRVFSSLLVGRYSPDEFLIFVK